MSRFIILTGPSGVGKDTLIRPLAAELNAIIGVSHTTRAPRPGEIDGYSYYFVSEGTFSAMAHDGAFIEMDVHFNTCYGFAWHEWHNAASNDRDLLVILDPNGMRQALRQVPTALTLFLMPAFGAEQLRDQMRARGDRDAQIETRLARAAWEMAQARDYDGVVWNTPGRLDDAVDAAARWLREAVAA